MLLMCRCFCCADAAFDADALMLLTRWFCKYCWWTDTADASYTADLLMLLMCWCCWCADAADALMLLMCWCCWRADAADALVCWSCWCADPADALNLLMHWSCWCTDADDALMLLMYWCCWCTDALMLLNQDQDLLADLSIAICSSLKDGFPNVHIYTIHIYIYVQRATQYNPHIHIQHILY